MSVTDVAIEKLKQMITSGELRPGDRLPKEAELAKRLGLSRSSLRESVRALTLIRILDVRQGDGTYVSSLEPDVLLDAVSFVIDFHQDQSVLDLLEARRVVESATAALAAQYISDAQLAELERILAKLTASATVEELVENDLAFHRAIAVAAGNPVLASLLDTLAGRTARARIWRGVTQTGALERTHAEHRAIFDALAHRQPELARAMVVVHVAGVEAWLELALDGDEDDGAAAAA
jgi:GntR family transcriptional repressor for pyruvate dehydrogenase complex